MIFEVELFAKVGRLQLTPGWAGESISCVRRWYCTSTLGLQLTPGWAGESIRPSRKFIFHADLYVGIRPLPHSVQITAPGRNLDCQMHWSFLVGSDRVYYQARLG